ncbi:MAG TPA: hypothetical protein VH164_03800 [Ktedonobacteraceae bacterium]|jgi:hypothetical protein|nr:hypothetical protein [Ktedonobacteraceae bacterium]
MIVELFATFAVKMDGDPSIRDEQILPHEHADLTGAAPGAEQEQEEGVIAFASQGLLVDLCQRCRDLLFEQGTSCCLFFSRQ